MKISGTVVRVERLRSTKNGNPRFCFVIDCPNLGGETHICTANDLMISYSVTEYNMIGNEYVFYCNDAAKATSWELISV